MIPLNVIYVYKGYLVISTSFMGLFCNFKFHPFKSLPTSEDAILQIRLHPTSQIRSTKQPLSLQIHPLKQ